MRNNSSMESKTVEELLMDADGRSSCVQIISYVKKRTNLLSVVCFLGECFTSLVQWKTGLCDRRDVGRTGHFWTFSIFVLFLEYQFFHCFSPLIVFFECISFLEIPLDLINLSLPFSFSMSPFYILSFLFKKTLFFLNCFRLCCLLFLHERHGVSSFFLFFFFAKESELRDKNLISLEEFILPVNFLKANDIIILSKPRKRDVFLFSGQLWRCWRSN